METPGIIAALVASVVVLGKVIDWLINKVSPGKDEEYIRQIRYMYEQVSLLVNRDIDSIKVHNEKIAEILARIAISQEKTADLQSTMSKLLIRINQQLEVESEVKRRADGRLQG